MSARVENRSILPLSVHALGFSVGDKALLEDISFVIEKGGVTSLIGPNGAGKSLTLRICHGLLKPSAGTVNWQEASGPGNRHKRHGMVFQRPVMLRRSALANIEHALVVTGNLSPRERAREALARFGLMQLAERPARLMSGGEQQRLAIARAWALDPECLFLDEPSSQLDPGATQQIEAIIAGLVADGMTIVMSTHDLGQARRLSTRILFLNKGRLTEDQDARSFFSTPRTAEARAFIEGRLLW